MDKLQHSTVKETPIFFLFLPKAFSKSDNHTTILEKFVLPYPFLANKPVQHTRQSGSIQSAVHDSASEANW